MTDIALPPITTDLAEAKRHLNEFGLCRLGDALTSDQLDAVRSRLEVQANAEVREGCSYHDGGSPDGRSAPNQRIWNLINKGEVFREIACASHSLELVKHMLGPDILLSSMTCNIARDGGVPMALHSDQNYIPVTTPYPAVVDIAWMVTDFTDDNGGTRVVPGSHKWGRYPNPGEQVETVAATGPAGTALIFDGRLWHGTGANKTNAPRYGLFTYYCRAFIRQQENFSLSLSPDVIPLCSQELLALLGFQVWHTLGMIEGTYHGTTHTRPTTFSRELS
ncbi:MAG: phytanoyl-CoA dioxygenase family protein [Pseudomonadales bacterium]|nr:phytanoyl-CoA dioxygenase family protein [Pseudomonadales bacterium]